MLSGGNWLKSCWDVEADPPSWGCAKREVSRGFPSREVRDVQPAESLQACCLLLHFIATGATHQPTFVCERSFKHEKSVWNIVAYISQHNETHSKVTHTCTHLHQNHLYCETLWNTCCSRDKQENGERRKVLLQIAKHDETHNMVTMQSEYCIKEFLW